jgi:hypothetical protein
MRNYGFSGINILALIMSCTLTKLVLISGVSPGESTEIQEPMAAPWLRPYMKLYNALFVDEIVRNNIILVLILN